MIQDRAINAFLSTGNRMFLHTGLIQQAAGPPPARRDACPDPARQTSPRGPRRPPAPDIADVSENQTTPPRR